MTSLINSQQQYGRSTLEIYKISKKLLIYIVLLRSRLTCSDKFHVKPRVSAAPDFLNIGRALIMRDVTCITKCSI